ncbi:MAG: hypothetical protein KGQ59_03375 [Bdellovibrionales bacterium]|nr:hypothetical protein [Bdellovibrionales bacterium]
MNQIKSLVAGISLLILLGACASEKLKKEWSEQRGYSQEDIASINKQATDGGYLHRIISARQKSNAYNTAPKEAEEKNLKNIWCNCWKRLADRCRQKADGLNKQDKELWTKANAVELAFTMAEKNGAIPVLDDHNGTTFDGAECP